MNGQVAFLGEEVMKLAKLIAEIRAEIAKDKKILIENKSILEFEPLARAMRGELVSIQSLIAAAIKFIDVFVPHLGNNYYHRNAASKLKLAKSDLLEDLKYPSPF